jgi:hypothetical protein
MESHEHRQLKRFGVALLLARGFDAAATEVRCPASRYRADAAGYIDSDPSRRVAPIAQRVEGDAPAPGLFESDDAQPPSRDAASLREPGTILIECKQSRGDFLSDADHAPELLRQRAQLIRQRERLERDRLQHEQPELRASGVMLFRELEEWDFTKATLGAYRECCRRLRRLDGRLYGQTKFWTLARYRVADRLYLLTPRGMVRPSELPEGWGLIEAPRSVLRSRPGSIAELADACAAAELRVRAPMLGSKPAHRSRLLRNIAAAATREMVRCDEAASVGRSVTPTIGRGDARTLRRRPRAGRTSG